MRRFGWLLASIACAAIMVAHATVSAQSPARPDITGSWDRYRGAGPQRGAGAPRDPLAPPPPGQPPLKPQYLKDWQARAQASREADARGEPIALGVIHCLPEGMPGMMNGPFPLEILQSRGQVTIIEEAYTQVRRILLDRPQKAIDDVEPGFYGHSIGRWDGDALVVDTIGVKESVLYQSMPHSKDMRIKERIHPVAPDIVWDEITIEDSTTLEKPWSFTFAYKRMPGYTLLEYICEDNREFADEQGRQKIRIDPARR